MKKIKIALTLAITVGASSAYASDYHGNKGCYGLPSQADLDAALTAVVDSNSSAGLDNQMWGTIVNRDGVVCAVARTGKPGEQWPGSRVISAQKANTANAFSLQGDVDGTGIALSTANLWAAVQPGGSLFGLQHSNPVDTKVAYRGNGRIWGTPRDPLVGKKIGGVNVFGGGVALYNSYGKLVGALGVSGDTSCTDHIVAWKTRDSLDLDTVPGGVSATGDDNMIVDPSNGFGHPDCGFGEAAIIADLPSTNPVE